MELGVNARGDVAEIWQDGEKVGTVWDWHITSDADGWSGTALKQSFRPSFAGGEVEARLLLSASSGDIFHVRGIATLSGCTPGEKSRQRVSMKGTRLWTVTTEAIPNRASS